MEGKEEEEINRIIESISWPKGIARQIAEEIAKAGYLENYKEIKKISEISKKPYISCMGNFIELANNGADTNGIDTAVGEDWYGVYINKKDEINICELDSSEISEEKEIKARIVANIGIRGENTNEFER